LTAGSWRRHFRGRPTSGAPICNLYSYTKGQAAIRELARAMHDRTGNLLPMPGFFPDYPAPIVRNGAEGRELSSHCVCTAQEGERSHER